jgi:hypothetical protein
MTLSPSARKLVLTVHVTTSVGWLGAVATFLALAAMGVLSGDGRVAHAVDLVMDLVTWCVLVPLCFSSLLSGILSALGTPWGLFQHYWVLMKLVMTILATIVLVVHLKPIGLLASVAKTTLTGPTVDISGLRRLLVAASVAALLVLLLLTTLSIYKPRGLTGWRGPATPPRK